MRYPKAESGARVKWKGEDKFSRINLIAFTALGKKIGMSSIPVYIAVARSVEIAI